MKARGKLVSLLMAIMCLLPIGAGLLGFGDSASAAEAKTVKVTLHKKQMDEWPDEGTINTGGLMDEPENFGKYKGLKGVEFTPYDITDKFYELLNAKLTGNESDADYEKAVREIIGAPDPETRFSMDKPAGTAKKTDDDGIVEFDLDDRKTDGTYKVYWFVETESDDYEEYSQPVILVLPAMDKNNQGEQLENIHLYPKNKVENEPKKEIIDDAGNVKQGEERYDYEVGKKIHYKASFNMPSQIGQIVKDPVSGKNRTKYSKLTFSDHVNKEGIRFEGIDKILIDGQDLTTEFTHADRAKLTLENDKNSYLPEGKYAGFDLDFHLNDAVEGTPSYPTSATVAAYLGTHAGKTVEIFYTVALTDDTEVDVDIENNFSVGMMRDGKDASKSIKEKPIVTTGGKKFKKHEKGDNTQVLEGAEFLVTRGTGSDRKYLSKNLNADNERVWNSYTVGSVPADALIIKSDDKGLFQITGLEYDTYHLVETKAPNGYQKGPDVEFVVNKGSFAEADQLKDVENVNRGGFLPSTGGIGIVIFLVIGGALMGFAINRYRKQQHAA